MIVNESSNPLTSRILNHELNDSLPYYDMHYNQKCDLQKVEMMIKEEIEKNGKPDYIKNLMDSFEEKASASNDAYEKSTNVIDLRKYEGIEEQTKRDDINEWKLKIDQAKIASEFAKTQ